MRQAIIKRTLEDGSEDITYIDLPSKSDVEEKPVSKSKKRKTTKKVSDEDNSNKVKEKMQATSTNKASVTITRAES